MKPIRLSMTAFGAYAATEIVNFTELGDRSFFLIHGETGAGKTTLLDAICFALYGETSGNERGAEQMRSHHTRTGQLTEVWFDFTLGMERYRIWRQPKQERPRVRGTGMIEEERKATMWQRTNCKGEEEEGEVLAGRWIEANEKVRELFGFDSKQFRQVIMLPQDQFRQLLKATSVERELLFQTLFQTEYYEKIALALKEVAKALGDEIKMLRSQCDSIVKQAGVVNHAALEAQSNELAEQQRTLEAELTILQVAEQLAQEQRRQAETVEERFVELEKARQALAGFQRRQAKVEQDRQTLEAARRALVMVEVEDALIRQQKAVNSLEIRSNEAQSAYKDALMAHEKATTALEQEKQRQPELDAERARRDELRGMFKRVQDLETARKGVLAAQAAVLRAEAAVEVADQRLEELKERLAELEQQTTVAQTAGLQAAELRATEKDIRQVLDARQRLDDLLGRRAVAEREQDQLTTDVVKAAEAAQTARESNLQLNIAWHAAQAAVLAQKLTPGQPCPVCGATHHPHPAQSGAELPSDEALEASQDRIGQAEKAQADAQKADSDHQVAFSDLKARIETLEPQLGVYSHWSLTQIQQELASITHRRQETEAQEKRLEQVKLEREVLRAKQPALEREHDDLDRAMGNARVELTAARTQVQERSEGLPTALQTIEAVTKVGKEATARVDQLEKAYEEALTNTQVAEKELATHQALWGQLAEQVASGQTESAAQAEIFQQRLQGNGFDSVVAYRQARRSKGDIDLLELQIAEYDAGLQSAHDRQSRAETETTGLRRPDLLAIRAAEAESHQKVVDSATQSGRLATRLEQIERWTVQLQALEVNLRACEQRYRVLGRVADVANGANEYKLNFQRFVLGALLDDVLVQASRRLQVMSNGRYLLQRRLEPVNKRRAAGLELDVTDTWTGESTRPVETLSGGESFLASLALALGLADAVQAYTGGIRLDTIFIDEGFGSLDTNALDRAIETLLSLNQGGRLVGIISHVESLKERISTRLEVSAGQQGSTARFIIN